MLIEALTHPSSAKEAPDGPRDYEQFEFLGDAILNFLVSIRLCETFPEWTEGRLSRARARLVAAAHLADVAEGLELGQYLRLGKGEEKTGGRQKAALRVNALEALVAAIYKDGGAENARQFVDRFVIPPDLSGREKELFAIDYKSALQERLQAERLEAASYRVVDEDGPEHQKMFTVEVTAGGSRKARGRGLNKKAAEQQAAESLLESLAKNKEAHG